MARPADERVGQREVERHAERVGDHEHEEHQRRGDEQGTEGALAIERGPQADAKRRRARRRRDPQASDRHRYPAMTFFISLSAQAIASLVDVPVTALASMLGRMNELVMSCTLSEAGAGHP